MDQRFLAYAIPAPLRIINDLTYFTTVKHLSSYQVLDTRIPHPPIEQQRAIADFLDRKTAAIDALIDKKKRLLDLLAEKRAALINRAVTRGLDPNVPMKDSGVPWIGEIPAHWEVAALGLVAEVFNGSTPPRAEAEFWGGDVAWCASGKVNEWRVNEPSEYVTASGVAAAGLRIAPVGSILLGLIGQGRTRGMAAYLAIESAVNQNVAAIVPAASKCNAEYLHLALTAAYKDVREGGRGGQQDALNCELVRRIKVPRPTLDEQRTIASRVAECVETVDRVSLRCSAQLDRLHEYRQALITAAVTGQLDVESAA